MIVDSMNSFLFVFIVFVKLKRFGKWIFIKQFGVVFYEPLCSSIAIENDDMFLSKNQGTN